MLLVASGAQSALLPLNEPEDHIINLDTIHPAGESVPPPPAVAETNSAASATPDIATDANTDNVFPENSAPVQKVLLLTDPVVLKTLEVLGLGFAERIGGTSFRGTSNAQLAADPRYGSMVQVLATDLQKLQVADPSLHPGMGASHRLFDGAWMKSSKAVFELSGVANRLDRQSFAPSSCGETRLVYRLKYSTQQGGSQMISRLPFSINLVYRTKPVAGNQGCWSIARKWKAPAALTGSALAQWMVSSGALNPTVLTRAEVLAVEVNLQTVRWPSGARPDLGGHAEYLMRVFHLDASGNTLAPAPMENTPNIAQLKANPGLLNDLKKWILDPNHLGAIDQGVAVIPDQFLAMSVVSVTPGGTRRLQNRPFLNLFKPSDFAGVNFVGRQFVQSPGSLLRRLDDMTCVGCHQARAIAGFHLNGLDRDGVMPANSVSVPISSHLARDLPRRTAFLDAVAANHPAVPSRPFSERAGAMDVGYGAHCTLGTDPAYASWTCKAGLECREVVADTLDGAIGECLPPGPPQIGDACVTGQMSTVANGHLDQIFHQTTLTCDNGAACLKPGSGFPNGMCETGCTPTPGFNTCGSLVKLVGFNACLAAHKPFTTCITENLTASQLRQCDQSNPCRDDYLCTYVKPGVGTCMPPYFLFEFRVDGHPSPM